MSPDLDPVPAAPTPRTPQQIAAILGNNATRTYPDEDVAPMLTVVQSGGRWQAYCGDPNDELTAVVPYAMAHLTPDDPSLPGEVAS